jgi:hypothetical protein
MPAIVMPDRRDRSALALFYPVRVTRQRTLERAWFDDLSDELCYFVTSGPVAAKH